jgi:hypothetical protein
MLQKGFQTRYYKEKAKRDIKSVRHIPRDVSHLFTGSLAGIGKLPALAGWYIWHGMYGIFCTVRFGGSPFCEI